jgi:L-aspartate oxidase
VHGANRLASNSLLECLVFGRRAALAARSDPPPALQHSVARNDMAGIDAVTPELRAELWRDAGLVRDAIGLEGLAGSPHTLARLIATSGLARRESRGGHFRTDFPFEDEAFAAHTVIRPGTGEQVELERWS